MFHYDLRSLCYFFFSASEGLARSSTGSEGKEEGESTATTEEAGGGGGGGGGPGDELPWAYTSDDSISFPVDCVLQGDLLVSFFSCELLCCFPRLRLVVEICGACVRVCVCVSWPVTTEDFFSMADWASAHGDALPYTAKHRTAVSVAFSIVPASQHMLHATRVLYYVFN